MMTNKTKGKKNPRKFAEKIALLNKKQSESTAEFENIIKEVERTTRTNAAPVGTLARIHKRRNSNVRGLADNLVSSNIDLNDICRQAEFDKSHSYQYQSSCHLAGTHIVDPKPLPSNMVPNITIYGIDNQCADDDCLTTQISTTGNATGNTANAHNTGSNEGYLTCNLPYSRASARSLPNIWNGISGSSTNNIYGSQSPSMGMSPASSMRRLTLEQRYNKAIARGNSDDNNYLNHQQQVPCNSWNGSGYHLNQKRPSYNDQVYHQNHYHHHSQLQPISRAVSSNCLRSITCRDHYHESHENNLYASPNADYMSKSVSNNINGYVDEDNRHRPQLSRNHYQLQAPSFITRSHSFGDIGDVYSHQGYSNNSFHNPADANNNSSNYYSYDISKHNPIKHYHNNIRNQEVSYNEESYNNDQCYECSRTYFQSN